MKRVSLQLLLLIVIGNHACWATSKLPPTVPLKVHEGRVIASLTPLIAETNDVEVSEVSLCQRYGSRCFQVIWRIRFSSGFKPDELELFKEYPNATVFEERPTALTAGGSYVLRIYFRELSERPKQTVTSTSAEFCLIENSGMLQVQEESTCLARRNSENIKKSDGPLSSY